MIRTILMKLTLLTTVLSALCGVAAPIFAQETTADAPKLPAKEKFLIVVLAGQSNMAGRGFVEPEDKIPNSRVLMLNRDGAWVPAVDPVHFDKSSAGVGPGRTFANLLAASDPTITVGLVPTACGGSSVDHWKPGVYFEQTKSKPFDDAISRTRRALEDGTLAAILWMQGESDCSPRKAAEHEEKLFALFEAFRAEWNAPNVPILVGELSRPLAAKSPEGFAAISAAQRAVVERSQPAAFVSSEGLTLNPDNVHFDRKSQIEAGKRYFEAFQALK